MRAAGEKPSANKIKAKWNAVRGVEFPSSLEVTKCASAQAILDLGEAFFDFFRETKKPKHARRAQLPRVKIIRQDDGFALWNDQFEINDKSIRIPHLGWVETREPLRSTGKVMSARVIRNGSRWHVLVHTEVSARRAGNRIAQGKSHAFGTVHR